ncbi:glycosyltransferase family 39 protein [Granulicella sp. S190]|uniref:glycosyltransferase family 39 protein n=1 Tax=Granulicella sp. S190 TaxID=1747226 RepID=UPI00131C6F81|nr:glycosyltransferase family 39 protein [Granulicella sp. S190]
MRASRLSRTRPNKPAAPALRGRGVDADEVKFDPEEVRPATRQETFPVALGAVLLSFIALLLSYSRGYLLLYGDAVAHLGIARRILDSRNPGLVQLGGVWLPLPHLLMLPFVQKMEWWQNGLAGAWPSLICYIASVAGIYRLTRRMMIPRWALAATALYALNPNLLYLSTTAMTEPLFLMLLIWTTLFTIECVAAIKSSRQSVVRSRLLLLAIFILAAVFTRYDGWILGAAVWCVITFCLARDRKMWRSVAPTFAVFTLLVVAGPVSWLAYNQHFFHDPLDFMRGPYSAAAIEKKTMPPNGHHHRGWHNPAWALLFYTRTAQVDAVFWETGFALMAAAIAGLVLTIRRRLALSSLLLWMPLPFYIYSVAYGSVPIFIPQLWPHSYYNSRYGMELLPALAVFAFLAVQAAERRWSETQPLVKRLMQPIALLLIALNTVGMMYSKPLVLKEALVNATTRVAFETALARQLGEFPYGSTIMMYNSDHIGALQDAAIPLRQTVNEGDYDSFQAALAAPAQHANYVVSIAGDPVAAAVAAHPEGLTELTILCTSGQPCARLYRSDRSTPITSK